MAQARRGSILCGVDGSEGSVRAARTAAALTDALGDELVLVHVGPQGAAGDEGAIAATREQAGLAEARSRRVESREVVDGLVAAARVEQPGLLTVGSRGRSALGAALLGSVSARLPLEAPCPVMVVPPKAAEPVLATAGRRPTVVCAVGGAPESRAAAAVGGMLASRLDARLVLGHVYSPQPAVAAPGGAAGAALAVDFDALLDRERRAGAKVLQKAAEWSAASVRTELRLDVGAPADRIQAIAREEDATLIVVGASGRGPLGTAVLGSTSRTLAGSARCPVVVVPPAA